MLAPTTYSDLAKHRQALQDEIAAIDRLLAGKDVSAKSGGGQLPKTTGGASPKEKEANLREARRIMVGRNNQSVLTSTLTEKLLERGHTISGQNPGVTFGALVAKSKDWMKDETRHKHWKLTPEAFAAAKKEFGNVVNMAA